MMAEIAIVNDVKSRWRAARGEWPTGVLGGHGGIVFVFLTCSFLSRSLRGVVCSVVHCRRFGVLFSFSSFRGNTSWVSRLWRLRRRCRGKRHGHAALEVGIDIRTCRCSYQRKVRRPHQENGRIDWGSRGTFPTPPYLHLQQRTIPDEIHSEIPTVRYRYCSGT